MKPPSDLLGRLLMRAAKSDRTALFEEPPFGLEGRIVAAWREQTDKLPPFELLTIFRRAFVCAVALVGVIGFFDLTARSTTEDPATGFANSTFLAAIDR